MGCRDFFDENGENAQKCKLLHGFTADELANWELETASALSPGIVADDEILYQQIVDPTHLTPDGKGLNPKVFDVCNSHGLSTHRASHISTKEIIEIGLDRAETYNAQHPVGLRKTLWGVMPFSTANVRKILGENTGTRAFFIFDTAVETDRSHAEICQGATQEKQTQRSVRTQLYFMVKNSLIPLGDFGKMTV